MNSASEKTVGTPKKFTYVWEIHNFSKIDVETGTAVCSPTFSTCFDQKTLQWRLKFYPNGYNTDNKDYVAIYLHNMNQFEVEAAISLSVINDSNQDVFKHVGDPSTKIPKFPPLRTVGWVTFEKKVDIMDSKNRTLLNDRLLISCTIFSTKSVFDGCDTDADNVVVSKYNEQLFETGNYSDVTFSIKGKVMRLHKNVVASLSPVFEAMFTNDMSEKKNNLVTITDINFDVMKELFRYIYTRKIDNIDIIAVDLLVAADKYAITDLKKMCESSLGSTMNEHNALQRLQLAVVHSAFYLKLKATEFIADRLKTFVERDDFKELSHDCKDEIFKVLANKLSIEEQKSSLFLSSISW